MQEEEEGLGDGRGFEEDEISVVGGRNISSFSYNKLQGNHNRQKKSRFYFFEVGI